MNDIKNRAEKLLSSLTPTVMEGRWMGTYDLDHNFMREGPELMKLLLEEIEYLEGMIGDFQE